MRSRKRPHDWEKLMIFYGSQIIQNSPCHTRFISWHQEEEFHKKFIGSNITLFPTFFPITTGALRGILPDSLLHGNCSYPFTSSDFNTVNVVSINYPHILTDILCTSANPKLPQDEFKNKFL